MNAPRDLVLAGALPGAYKGRDLHQKVVLFLGHCPTRNRADEVIAYHDLLLDTQIWRLYSGLSQDAGYIHSARLMTGDVLSKVPTLAWTLYPNFHTCGPVDKGPAPYELLVFSGMGSLIAWKKAYIPEKKGFSVHPNAVELPDGQTITGTYLLALHNNG